MPMSPRYAGSPVPSMIKPLRIARSSTRLSNGEGGQQGVERLADELIDRCDAVGVEHANHGFVIERDVRAATVVVGQFDQHLGVAVVTGGNRGGADHRRHATGGSTKNHVARQHRAGRTDRRAHCEMQVPRHQLLGAIGNIWQFAAADVRERVTWFGLDEPP